MLDFFLPLSNTMVLHFSFLLKSSRRLWKYTSAWISPRDFDLMWMKPQHRHLGKKPQVISICTQHWEPLMLQRAWVIIILNEHLTYFYLFFWIHDKLNTISQGFNMNCTLWELSCLKIGKRNDNLIKKFFKKACISSLTKQKEKDNKSAFRNSFVGRESQFDEEKRWVSFWITGVWRSLAWGNVNSG